MNWRRILLLSCAILLLIGTGAGTAAAADNNDCNKSWGQYPGWNWTADFDDDGLSNGGEVASCLNAFESNDHDDADDDDLYDIYEAKHPDLDPHEENDASTKRDFNNNNIPDRIEHNSGLDLIAEYDGPDSDNDGLTDKQEQTLGTNPEKADSDSDGYEDKVEIVEPGPLEEMDPMYKDVFLEYDAMEDISMSDRFDRANYASDLNQLGSQTDIQNPNGKKGFDVHIIKNENNMMSFKEKSNTDDLESDIEDIDEAHHTYQKYGYIHVIHVNDITDGTKSYGGFAYYESNTIFLARLGGSSNVLFHELGHVFGVKSTDAPGVDNPDYTIDEYPSIMNYNAYVGEHHGEILTFSDGSAGPKDHNDLEHVRNYFESQDFEINEEYGS